MSEPIYWLILTATFTALQPFPYMIERILRIGMLPAMGYSKVSGHGDSNQPNEQIATWAKRAYRAHYNSIEYLAVFGILVISAHLLNNDNPIIATAALVYFTSRIAHYIVYILGIPILRTLVFVVSLTALLTITFALIVGI